AFGLGFVIGPAVGGYLGNINLRFPFWAAAILSLTNTLYGFFILPESLPPERRAKSAWHMANPMGSLNLFRSHPQLAGLAVVTTLYYLAHQSLQTVYVLYTEYRYAWKSARRGPLPSGCRCQCGNCLRRACGPVVDPLRRRPRI